MAPSIFMLFLLSASGFWVFSLGSVFKDDVKVKPGEDVVLQCQDPREDAIEQLEWSRPDLKSHGYVFFYRNDRAYEKYQHPSFHGRVELRHPKMKDGDASVILKKVNINDAGTYECHVGYGGSRPELISTIDLSVDEPGEAAGHTEDGGDKDAGDKDAGDKDAGDKDVHVGLVVGLSAAALILSFVGFMIYRKCKLRQDSEQLAVE